MTKPLKDLTTGVTDAAGKAGKTAGRTGRAATGAATGTAKKAGESVREGAGSGGGLLKSLQNLGGTVAESTLSKVSDTVSGTTGRLQDYAEGGGGSLVSALTGNEKTGEDDSSEDGESTRFGRFKEAAKDKFEGVKDALTGGKGKGGGGKKIKLTNIVESIDVGVPLDLAYDLWTQFADWPKFMKKVEQVEQVEDEKLHWTGKVFWSRRNWESTILEQVPFERIVWRSKGPKGYIDGAVTFHELVPGLTRIVLVLEYHPRGLFERTANLWRAVGRRSRLELKHFRRHAMTEAVLHPDDIVGWHGEIRDSEVVKDDETARQEEEDEANAEGDEEGTAEGDEEDFAEGDEEGTAEGDEEDLGEGEEEDTAEGDEEDLAEGEEGEEDLAEGDEEDTAEGDEELPDDEGDEDTAEGDEIGLAEGDEEDTAGDEEELSDDEGGEEPDSEPAPARRRASAAKSTRKRASGRGARS